MKLPTFPRIPSPRNTTGGDGVRGGRFAPKSKAKVEKVCRLCRIHRQGAAAVEFALVAPVLFLLIFGMLEFGRMVMVQQVITNGSREGARIAVLDGTTGTEVVSTVETFLEGARVAGATVTVDPTEPSSAGYGDPVTVTVSVPFSQVSWLPSPMFIGGETELTATTVMRRETVQ